MPQVRQYLRYNQEGIFNVIASSNSNIKFINWKGIEQTFCIVGACENVQVWNLKTATKIATLNGNKQVTRICVQPSTTSSKVIAVGFSNGDIKLFNLSTGEVSVSFEGHKSEITSLEFDNNGMRLVSGSLDTNVIVWDVVNDCGLYRLKGLI